MTIPWILLAVVVYAVIGAVFWHLIAFMTMDTHEPYDLAQAGAVFWPLLLVALLCWFVVMSIWVLLRSMWMWARVLTRRGA